MVSLSDLLASVSADQMLSVPQTLAALGLAYGGGILASLTPCVYPMIPITVSVIGGMGDAGTAGARPRRAWHELWMRGIAYVGGMALVYSFLGVLAGVSGRVFGSFTNTPAWYLGLGILFAFASLAMMDVIPFDPAIWWDGLKRRARKLVGKSGGRSASLQEPRKEMTWVGAFSLGASSGFIAAPCTTPVLTTILAAIAKTQSVGLGFGLMLFFSLGLGTILLLIAAFAGAVRFLPRSGGWMNRVKVASGLILLAFSGYLIYRSGQLGGI